MNPSTVFPAFLGPIGTPELILLLIVMGIPVVIGIVIFVVLSQRKRPGPPPPPLPAGRSVEERLADLDSLRSKNLITEAEYQEKRDRIISSV